MPQENEIEKEAPPAVRTQVRIRLHLGDDIAMGPGKADLLDAIAQTGSISAAAREMGMSYRRAWLLVDTMNQSFREPLVTAKTGGKQGGGAGITPFGRDVLNRYRALVALACKVIAEPMAELQSLLQPAPVDTSQSS
jgi:molybdate transport system regulatory protein